MTCRQELESREEWRAYLERVAEKEAWDAIYQVWHLANSSKRYGKNTEKRMQELVNDGVSIYAERFGCEWIPF